MSPLLTRRRVLAVKAEVTPGTAVDLTATEAAFNAFDTKINPNIEFVERPGQSSLSPLTGSHGGESGQVSFRVELSQSANLTVLLTGCAMALDSGAYKPASGSTTTLTIGVYENGLLKRLRGAMGTFVMNFEAGKPVSLEFTFTGIWEAPSDVTILAPTYPSYDPPRLADSSILIGAWAPKFATMSIDRGNEVVLREDPSDPSGYCAAHVTGWKITGSIDPEAGLVATNDPYGDLTAHTEAALAIVVGASGGDQVDIDGPALQFTNVQEADRNGLQTDAVEFQLNRSADAGDDELAITLS